EPSRRRRAPRGRRSSYDGAEPRTTGAVYWTREETSRRRRGEGEADLGRDGTRQRTPVLIVGQHVRHVRFTLVDAPDARRRLSPAAQVPLRPPVRADEIDFAPDVTRDEIDGTGDVLRTDAEGHPGGIGDASHARRD